MSDSTPETSPGLARQMGIYQGKLAGKTPELPVGLEELELRARSVLSPEAFDYLAGGAGSEDTMRANLAAFRRWRLVPRLLRDVSRRDLGIELFGRRLPLPLLLAPIGVQGILHRDAELATARAAASLGIPLVVSTVSSRPLEEVAVAMGDAPRWFQLYWPRSDALAASLISRAERAGYGAIVVTLDTYLLAWRERDIRNAYLPFLHGEGLGNYVTDPVFQRRGRGRSWTRPKAHPRVLRPGFLRPLAHLDRPGPPAEEHRDCRSSLKASCTPTTPGRPSTTALTASSSRITGAGSSTERSPHSMLFLRSSGPWGTAPPSSSTAGFDAVPT